MSSVLTRAASGSASIKRRPKEVLPLALRPSTARTCPIPPGANRPRRSSTNQPNVTDRQMATGSPAAGTITATIVPDHLAPVVSSALSDLGEIRLVGAYWKK
jgi:hypothetical protein